MIGLIVEFAWGMVALAFLSLVAVFCVAFFEPLWGTCFPVIAVIVACFVILKLLATRELNMTEKNEIYLDPGTQILYVPAHAEGNYNHDDVEIGFVTSVRTDTGTVYCRYWNKYGREGLRTKANSEGTPMECIVVKDSVPQAWVDAKLAEILEEQAAQDDRKPS